MLSAGCFFLPPSPPSPPPPPYQRSINRPGEQSLTSVALGVFPFQDAPPPKSLSAALDTWVSVELFTHTACHWHDAAPQTTLPPLRIPTRTHARSTGTRAERTHARTRPQAHTGHTRAHTGHVHRGTQRVGARTHTAHTKAHVKHTHAAKHATHESTLRVYTHARANVHNTDKHTQK